MSWLNKTFQISHADHRAIVSMEGIRGFAVFLVFLVHYVTLIAPWINASSFTYLISNQVKIIGHMGVDLFFVLSGYLIYGMLITKRKSFTSYIVRRIQRIYPTFTVVFLIYLVLSVIFPSESKIPQGWAGLLYVLQNFLLLPGLFDIRPIITVAWSLSYEFFYYLFIPLAIELLRLRLWRWEKRVALLCGVSVLGFAYCAAYGGHIRLLMFVAGVLLFEVIENKKPKRMPAVGLPALILAMLSVVLFNEIYANGWWKYPMLFILFFVFCMDCFAGHGWARRVFIFTPMRWLGNMSYSYYLIHGLTLKFLFLAMAFILPPYNADTWLFWVMLPLAFLVTLIPSTMLFALIEKPYSLAHKKISASPALGQNTAESTVNRETPT